jgi:energy-coupling factor transport system permease protein
MTAINPFAEQLDYGPVRFLHRLNPLAKIAAPLPAMVLLLLARDVATPVTFAAIALVLLLIGAYLRARAILLLLVVLPLAVGVLSFSFGFWVDSAKLPDSPVLLQVGGIHFTVAAWMVGLATATRLTSIIVLSLLAGLTSTGADLVRAMVQQLHVPYRVGYTALAAFRFVPRFGHELEVIRAAHRVRGMAGGRGPLAGARHYLGYVVPLLAGAIRHAERVALAMDSRAFGAHRTRTERHRIPFRARDGVFIVLFWGATAAIFLLLPR